MKIENIKYNLTLKKNSLVDRIKGVNRKRVSAYAVLIFMLALLPATVFLTQRMANLNKQAASCGGTSAFLTFTDLNGNTITRANNGDRFRVHLFLTGELDAADIFINFDNSKIQPPANGIQMNNGSNFYIQHGGIALDSVLTLSLLRNYQAPRSINQEIVSADFTVITPSVTTMNFSFVEPTLFANLGQGKSLSCARNNSLSLNQEAPLPSSTVAAPTTSVPASSACPNYLKNCLDPDTQNCSGSWDNSKSCQPNKKCCIPTAVAPTSVQQACPNYWKNCIDVKNSCSGTWDDTKACGPGFRCCLPSDTGVTVTPTSSAIVPSATPVAVTATPTVTTPTPKPACPNYWTNCKRQDLGETCSGTWNENYACGVNFTCCVP